MCHVCVHLVESSGCRGSCFEKDGWGSLACLCPSLKELSLDCGNIAPSTISILVDGLPQLTAGSVSSSGLCYVMLAEGDIMALRRLGSVCLPNISGGIRNIVWVGTSIILVAHVEGVKSVVMKELVLCMRVRSIRSNGC